jgi:hypothetical protein
MLMFFMLTFIPMWDDNDIKAGPEVGKPIPELKLSQIHGADAGKEVDARELAKPASTIFITIRKDKWDRPVARVLRQLDEAVAKQDSKAQIVIVWVSKDADHAKEYLPKAQQSLKLSASSWNHFNGEVYDAAGWQLSGDGPLNIIITKAGKVHWGRAFATVDEKIVNKVTEALAK